MHIQRKVGTNVGNPHSWHYYFMLNSITYKLVFDDVLNARKCVFNVAHSHVFNLYHAYQDRGSDCHVVIVNALRCGDFGYDKFDMSIIADGCKEGSFDWSFDIMTEEELDLYIDWHKK